jgi:hypothetical protein
VSTEGDKVSESVDIRDLEKLVQVISRPQTRRSFLKDPEGALKQAGADIPDGLRDALAELSPAELRLVSHLNTTLLAAGLRAPDSDTVGIV